MQEWCPLSTNIQRESKAQILLWQSDLQQVVEDAPVIFIVFIILYPKPRWYATVVCIGSQLASQGSPWGLWWSLWGLEDESQLLMVRHALLLDGENREKGINGQCSKSHTSIPESKSTYWILQGLEKFLYFRVWSIWFCTYLLSHLRPLHSLFCKSSTHRFYQTTYTLVLA